jgi:hypothetical protein
MELERLDDLMGDLQVNAKNAKEKEDCFLHEWLDFVQTCVRILCPFHSSAMQELPNDADTLTATHLIPNDESLELGTVISPLVFKVSAGRRMKRVASKEESYDMSKNTQEKEPPFHIAFTPR